MKFRGYSIISLFYLYTNVNHNKDILLQSFQKHFEQRTIVWQTIYQLSGKGVVGYPLIFLGETEYQGCLTSFTSDKQFIHHRINLPQPHNIYSFFLFPVFLLNYQLPPFYRKLYSTTSFIQRETILNDKYLHLVRRLN